MSSLVLENDKSQSVSAPAATGSVGDGKMYPTGIKLVIIVGSLCMSLFLCGLDQTVITTAAPIITNEFHALDDIGWYTTAYLLTTSTFQIAYGKLYTTLSIKYVFLASLAIFEIGSIVCAAASSSTTLIVGRAVAGLGAAGIFPGGTLILVNSAPMERRPTLLGLMTGMFGVASLCGPFVGGAFADNVTWRWCFIINLPLGLVTALVIIFFVSTSLDLKYQSKSFAQRVASAKLPEVIILVGALICLVLALQQGGAVYPWSDSRVIALLVVFAVLTMVSLAIQVFLPNSRTVPTAIVANRNILFGGLFALCSSGAMFVAVTYLPVYFQVIKGASALSSGVMVIPLILGFLITSIIAGIFTNVTGYYNPSMFLCAILASIGGGLISTFGIDTPQPQWIGYQALLGCGIGFGLQQPLVIAQHVLEEGDVPLGIALTNMMQMLGGVIFVAVSQSILQNNLATGIKAAIPTFNTSLVFKSGVTELLQLFTQEERKIALRIYSRALDQVFLVVTGLCAATLIGALGTQWQPVKKQFEADREADREN